MELTQQQLKTQVHYNPRTGIFKRTVKTSKANIGDEITRKTNRGYIQFSVLGKLYSGHRLAWLYEHGKFPKNQIDHINHDRIDNRIDNLREATNAENHKNRTMQSNNTSGYNGVYWREDRRRWYVSITIDQKTKHIGYFKAKDDAVSARKEAEKKYNFYNNYGKS